jgi:hypothetical protein
MTVQSSAMAEVQARIAEIKAEIASLAPRRQAAVGVGQQDFAAALSTAEGAYRSQEVRPGDVVAAAAKYLGVPYRWGGTDPDTGLDCSGYVQQVYEDLGISLPRVSRDQAKVGTAVPDLASARPGDLVAFGDPVHPIGIYIGNNRKMVSPHTGAVVTVQDVPSDWTAIRRVLPDSTGGSASVGGAGGVAAYSQLFESAGARYGLPANVLAAVARAESGGNPGAVSPAGAQGLMQLMPGTARGLGVDPFNPAQAVDGAARLLAGNLQRFGTLDQALAAYNAGPGAVEKYGGVPPYRETRNYVNQLLDELHQEAQ